MRRRRRGPRAPAGAASDRAVRRHRARAPGRTPPAPRRGRPSAAGSRRARGTPAGRSPGGSRRAPRARSTSAPASAQAPVSRMNSARWTRRSRGSRRCPVVRTTPSRPRPIRPRAVVGGLATGRHHVAEHRSGREGAELPADRAAPPAPSGLRLVELPRCPQRVRATDRRPGREIAVVRGRRRSPWRGRSAPARGRCPLCRSQLAVRDREVAVGHASSSPRGAARPAAASPARPTGQLRPVLAAGRRRDHRGHRPVPRIHVRRVGSLERGDRLVRPGRCTTPTSRGPRGPRSRVTGVVGLLQQAGRPPATRVARRPRPASSGSTVTTSLISRSPRSSPGALVPVRYSRNVDFALTADQAQVRDLVREFATEIAPGAGERDEHEEFPRHHQEAGRAGDPRRPRCPRTSAGWERTRSPGPRDRGARPGGSERRGDRLGRLGARRRDDRALRERRAAPAMAPPDRVRRDAGGVRAHGARQWVGRRRAPDEGGATAGIG